MFFKTNKKTKLKKSISETEQVFEHLRQIRVLLDKIMRDALPIEELTTYDDKTYFFVFNIRICIRLIDVLFDIFTLTLHLNEVLKPKI